MEFTRRSRSSQKDASRPNVKQAWTSSTKKPITSDDDFEYVEHSQPSLQELFELLKTKLPELARKAQTEVDGAFLTESDKNENRKLRSEHDDLRKLNEKLEKQIKETESKCKDEVYSLKRTIERQRKEIDELKKAQTDRHTLNEKRTTHGQDDNTTRRKQQSYDSMALKLKETEDELRHSEAELDETKTRLSRSIGEKLIDNNPNIADISDKNRPTKLAERYKELYDTQWTEAFETIDETYKNEEKCTGVLVNILMTLSKLRYGCSKQGTGTNEWKDTKKQLYDLETRHIAVAGRMRPDSKTNIADLSDENRPTKLAERYSKLCENEWISAFEILTEGGHRTEENACQILANAFCVMSYLSYAKKRLFKIIYSTCRKEADADLEVQTNAMKSLHKIEELPSEMVQNIKDRRRIYPDKYIARIEKLYDNDMKKILTAEERRCLSQFIQKSINLCWLMAIHHPPVYIDTDLTHMGELFNAKHFRQYKTTGEYTDFTIWPSLYLFKGGDMLCKGIVRGKRILRISELYENKEMSGTYTRGFDKGLSEKESKRMQYTRLNEDSTATPRCNAYQPNVTSNVRTSSPKKYESKKIVHTSVNVNGNGRQPGKYITIINT